MYTLMQIVVFLNTSNVPQVTLLTHLENAEQCEKKINQAYDRYKSAGLKTILNDDDEGNSFLEYSIDQEDAISYMFCKKAIFFE